MSSKNKYNVETSDLSPEEAEALVSMEVDMPEKKEYPVAVSAWPDQLHQRLLFTVKVRAYDQTSAMVAMSKAVLGGPGPDGRPYKLWRKLNALAPDRKYVAVHFE